jgi:hypothetical protein
MQSPAIDAINAMQRRILAGEDPSAEEMSQVIQQLRSERAEASTARAAKKAKANPPPVDISALFAKPSTTSEPKDE